MLRGYLHRGKNPRSDDVEDHRVLGSMLEGIEHAISCRILTRINALIII